MELDKFYIPEIEEFCIGFEYELKFKNESWTKEILCVHSNLFRISNIINEESHFNIRVKYLDKSDIESLGFEEIGEGEYCFSGHRADWILEKIYDNNIKSFYRIRNANKTQNLFLEIKNKNELSKLLKQINIK